MSNPVRPLVRDAQIDEIHDAGDLVLVEFVIRRINCALIRRERTNRRSQVHWDVDAAHQLCQLPPLSTRIASSPAASASIVSRTEGNRLPTAGIGCDEAVERIAERLVEEVELEDVSCRREQDARSAAAAAPGREHGQEVSGIA